MESNKIDKLIGFCGEISAFLIEVKHRFAEFDVPTVSETVERLLDGLSYPRPSPGVVVSKENKGEIRKDEIFTKKEISSMPKLKDLSYRYRKDGCHEFRYRRNGFDKSFTSTDFKVAKKKAMAFIEELNAQEATFGNKAFVRFETFANHYLNNVKKVNVTEHTFSKIMNRYQNYVLPAFRGKTISDIKAPAIQHFLNGIVEKGYQRTAEECFYILKTIFQYAVDNDIITKNPVGAVKIRKHQRTIGQAISLDVEKAFIEKVSNTIYKARALVMLYTGCRPCELETASLMKDGFITFQNKKQHNGKLVYKDVPITPMLMPYIEEIKADLPFTYTDRMKKTLAEFLKPFRVYDLRHTFATRCQECGVPQEVVGVWLGHKGLGMTGSVYTHFSPKFMLEQAEKVVYSL